VAIRIVRLGSPRHSGEGVRLGTVRHPPRGVPKTRYSTDNFFDVWLPNLAPSAELLSEFRKSEANESAWKRFSRKYEVEMARSENSRVLDTLAALSQESNFSVGCYCVEESKCHRGVLRRILKKHGANVID